VAHCGHTTCALSSKHRGPWINRESVDSITEHNRRPLGPDRMNESIVGEWDRAALIPHSVALERASFVEYTNSHKFMLRDDVWSASGVRDVTAELHAVIL
jgi:hypothetical protein